MNFIKKKIKDVIGGLIDSLGYEVINKENFTPASFVLESAYGHAKSVKTNRAIDANNASIPWFTYPAIEYFKQLDLSNKIMLEWGSGSSSLFFSKRVKKIYSIEHDGKWYEKVKENQSENQELYLCDTNYADKPKSLGISFDIILIDGINREKCAEQTLNLINKKGLIILDNSDRYPEIGKYFRDNGYIEVDFHGFGPINNYTWTTSIFLDREVELKPLEEQPLVPIGGGY